MNWKQEAIYKLKNHGPKVLAVENILDELAVLKADFDRLQGVTTDGVRVSGTGTDHEDTKLSNIVRRGELVRALSQTKTQALLPH